jgi:DNA-binding SARP family transcriptional activator
MGVHSGRLVTTTYFLRVLGTASLGADDPSAAAPLLGPGKPLALITYLALSPQRTATREHLLDLLWADAEPERARRNLRQALYQMRRIVGDDFITASNDHLSLAASVRVDRDEFVAAAERGDLARAVELYAGPFFPAYAAPGGAAFEQWADLERQRLHAAWLRALESLVRLARQQLRLRDAVTLARRLRDGAPEREAGWRLLIESLTMAGDWVGAAGETDALEAMLRELERAPEPATQAVIGAARQMPAPSATTAARLVAEMVGREAEYAAVVAAWEAAARGRLRHLHVTGTAGIGKSRLLRDAAARIAAVGGRVVMARANQGERDLPYALAGDITRALAALPGSSAIAPATAGILLGLDPALSARFPAARHVNVDGPEGLRLRTMALVELVAAVADEQPLALILDDLHWADSASRQLVNGLASRAAESPVFLLTAARPVPDGTAVGRPDDVVMLRPLSLDQSSTLMDSLAAVSDRLRAAGVVTALHESAGGSPLLLLETLQHAMDNGWLVREADEWRAGDLPALLASLALGSAIDRRIATLSTPERRVLLSLAASGAPVPGDVLTAMTRHADHDAAGTVMSLEQHGFAVRREDGSWDTAHDLLAERLLAGAPRADLQAAHAALGRALADSAGDEPIRLQRAARHLRQAADRVALHDVFRRFVRSRRQLGDSRPAAAMAPELLGEVRTDEVRSLVRSLPLTLRVTRRTWAAAATAAGVLLLAIGYVWLTTADRLAVTQFSAFTDDWGRGRPIAVEALDRRGRRDRSRHDTVYVESAPRPDGIVMRASPAFALMREGRAEFSSLRLVAAEGARPLQLTTLSFRTSALGSVKSDTVVLSGGMFLDSAVVNGQHLSPQARSIIVRPGERIVGRVALHYSEAAGTAVVMMVVAPTWGDRTQFMLPRAFPANIVRDTATILLDLPGPTRPGRYRLVFAAGMESEARFVASATNWTVQQPAWFDGNDLADISDSAAGVLDHDGGMDWRWLTLVDRDARQAALTLGRIPQQPARSSATKFRTQWLIGTTLEVIARR